MKNIYSNIYSFNKKVLRKTIKSLKLGNIIGLPTETVYGLAGNAYSKKAVKNIFKLKKRPRRNPLIIHYYNMKDAKKDIIINDSFQKLYKKFCPGPLTFILKKKRKSKICDLAISNLNTVAIRFPKHKITRSILKSITFPLSMPSANISAGLSPTNAFDVFEEFKNKIKIIIDGGRSKIGIESTVIDLTEKPRVLRPGIVVSKDIKSILKKGFAKKEVTKILSPGMMKKHYSPGIPVILGKKPKNLNHAYIVFGKKYRNYSNYYNLSKKGSLKEAASNLYKIMRKIKNFGYKKIFVSKIPQIGLGLAINDRLKRASK